MTLAELLQREVSTIGIVALAQKTGVAHTSIQNIIDGSGGPPRLETFSKFSKAFNVPLWRVIEMGGFDLGLDGGAQSQAQRLNSLLDALPDSRSVVGDLLELSPDDFRADEMMTAYTGNVNKMVRGVSLPGQTAIPTP